jgi:hypothetical protein
MPKDRPHAWWINETVHEQKSLMRFVLLNARMLQLPVQVHQSLMQSICLNARMLQLPVQVQQGLMRLSVSMPGCCSCMCRYNKA